MDHKSREEVARCSCYSSDKEIQTNRSIKIHFVQRVVHQAVSGQRHPYTTYSLLKVIVDHCARNLDTATIKSITFTHLEAFYPYTDASSMLILLEILILLL